MLSPIGKVLMARLDVPDTRFSADGVYSIMLEFSAETNSDFMSYLDYQMEQAAANAKAEHKLKKIKEASVPYALDLEAETFKVIFKMKAGNAKPEVFDTELNPIDPSIPVGSLVRVSYTPSQFYTSLVGAGISLRLQAVQVQQLDITHPVTAKYGFTPLTT
jgi:hypothetical protein